MHSEHFDHLVSRLGAAGTRRRLLRLSALPLVGGLAAFLTEGNEGAAKNKKKKRKKKHKRKRCKTLAQVCAGKCGTVTYTCPGEKKPGQVKTAHCGPCTYEVCSRGGDFTSVQAAIDAADPGDTIRLCLETFTEDIEIDKDLTIIGSHKLLAQSTLQGTGNGAVVDVGGPASVSLAWLWITGGISDWACGGINNYNSATLTLHNCAIFGNTAGDGGGGICNDEGGTLKMTDCAVFDNTAGTGGGIYSDKATLEMTDCAIFGNSASGSGGGIGNFLGTVTLSGCTISGNTAGSHGGGIANLGTVTLQAGTTVTENDADDGGGIYNDGFLDEGTSTCSGGSSVSGNTPNNCVAVDGGSCGGC